MKKLILDRSGYSEQGTFGIFKYNYLPVCVSLELPWRDNKVCVSCIPVGDYLCNYKDGKFHVENVSNRTYIQIHTGNYISDVQGCVLAGSEFSTDKKKGIIVYNSRLALERLKKALRLKVDEQFILSVS